MTAKVKFRRDLAAGDCEVFLEAIQIQLNHNTPRDFAELHYEYDPDHIGAVHIWKRAPGDAGPRYMEKVRVDDLEDRLESLEYDESRDLYITANSFVRYRRDMDDLYTLYNIVIDVDVHDGFGSLPDCWAGQLERAVRDRGTLPDPNTVVHTGRGLQLWWAIEPASYKVVPMYRKAVRWLTGEVRAAIGTVASPGLREKADVDSAASINAAGLFRLPGSFNTKSGTWGYFEILHYRRLKLGDICGELSVRNTAGSRNPKIPKGGLPVIAAAASREESLMTLISVRDAELNSETRDLILFCDYCVWSEIIHDHEDIMEHLRSLNRLFREPLSEAELEAYMSTARRKRYRITNATIIDKLAITAEEQRIIGLYPNRREMEREARRDAKRLRNELITGLGEKGLTHAEIAMQAGCSVRTVERILASGAVRTRDIRGAACG